MNRTAYTAVKICGVRSEKAVEALKRLPVDYAGFVFAKSRRQVTPKRAAELIAQLHDVQADENRPETVGVFVDPTPEQLTKAIELANLDWVQMHGRETPDFCKMAKEQFGVRVIKVMPVAGSTDADSILQSFAPYTDIVDVLMLDTYDPVYGGGTGRPFRWDILPQVKAWAKSNGLPLFVAGGVREENVRELIEHYAPDGVDISSGVETDGQQDPVKMENFVKRVKT